MEKQKRSLAHNQAISAAIKKRHAEHGHPCTGKTWLRTLDPDAATKVCPRCGVDKSKDQYHRSNRYSDGLQTYCKDCNRAIDRKRNLRRQLARYGLTPERFDYMLQDQSGRCVICADELVKIAIDHDHGTGVVRALLCNPCNIGIGLLKDRADVLEAAAQYLSGANVLAEEPALV